jgi:uncharacterized membrane protein YozB (DUF420 family)
MAILLIGRSVSKMSIASSISSMAAALFIIFPFMGFKDPFLPGIFLLMGVSIDIMYRLFYNEKYKTIILALIGGLAYMLIPLSRIMIHITTAYPYQSLIKGGYIFPVFRHFVFGILGGLFASALIYTTKKIRE